MYGIFWLPLPGSTERHFSLNMVVRTAGCGCKECCWSDQRKNQKEKPEAIASGFSFEFTQQFRTLLNISCIRCSVYLDLTQIQDEQYCPSSSQLLSGIIRSCNNIELSTGFHCRGIMAPLHIIRRISAIDQNLLICKF